GVPAWGRHENGRPWRTRCRVAGRGCVRIAPRAQPPFRRACGRPRRQHGRSWLPLPRSMLSPRHAEAALGDDVLLDLRSAAADREAGLPEVLPLEAAL